MGIFVTKSDKNSLPFATPFNRPVTLAAKAGDDYIFDYTKTIDKDGNTVLEKSKRNLTEELQVLAPQCDIELQMARLSIGDADALNQVKEIVFGDTVGKPKNMIEAHQMVKKARLEFDSLPLEVRKEFDFDVEKYVSQYGSDDFNSKLEKFVKTPLVDDSSVPNDNVPSEGGDDVE